MMEEKIQGIINKIETCEDLLNLKEILIHIKKELGFSHVLYAIDLTNRLSKIRTVIISDYPEKWVSRYIEMNYVKIDPAIRHCEKSHKPYCWDQASKSREKDVIKMLQEKATFKLIGGISIGIPNFQCGANYFSVASEHVIETGSVESLRTILFLTSIHPYLNEAVIRLLKSKQLITKKPQLTKRELACLSWIVKGNTSHETAEILSISDATVIFHLKNVIKKLNAKNRNHAIAEAMLLGIITPQLSLSCTADTYHI